jgi:pilus assembly protein CpaF
VVTFTAVNIRKFVLRAARLHDLVELGSMPPRAAAFLEASIRAGLNVLVQADPGRQDHHPQLPGCGDPGGERVISAAEVF